MTDPVTPAATARVGWRDALAASLVTTLARPSSWALALAGFLARGGLLVFLLPIVPLPTTASLANEVEPWLRPVFLGNVSAEFVILATSIVVGLVAWLVLGGIVGAWADVVLIREAARDEELGFDVEAPPPTAGLVLRAVAVRLLAHLPLVLALAAAAPVVVSAVYSELTNPGEVVTPLFQRTLGRIPEVVALVVASWLAGEVAGGFGVRRLVLGGGSVGGSAIGGYGDIVRGPVSSVATFVTTTFGVAIAIVPAALAAGLAWSFVRLTLLGGRPLREVLPALGVFILVWSGGLVLTGAATAWRGHAWTAEWLRRAVRRGGLVTAGQRSGVGTIGGPDRHRRGGWSSSGPSGTL